MASNQVEASRRADAAYRSAKAAGVKGKDLDTLKAQADAARARTPGGKGGGFGIFD